MRARSGPLAAVLLLALGFCLVGIGPTSAAPDRPAGKSSSRWLARQLEPDGTLRNPLGGALPDHGLMIDTLFALHAAGDGARATRIADYLDTHAEDYFTWEGLIPGQGFDAVVMGGAAAKTLVAAEVAGRDPRNFGGYDMVAETQGAIMRSGPDRGRISDYAKNPDLAGMVVNNSNVFGQALGVIGLAGVRENDRLAIDRLLTQQCAEGYFRVFFGYIPTDEVGDHVTPNGLKLSTCDEGKSFGQSTPDGDTTGVALSGLLAARAAGATGLDRAIGRAVAWLKANQTAGGGWGGGVGTEAPNTNSTGLIVQALADAGGADNEVDKGVAFIRSVQVTSAADGANALAGQIGAIAYDPGSYTAAKTDGITGVDTWIRASAQASLGLSQVSFHDLTQGEVSNDPPGGDTAKPGANPGAAPPPAKPPRAIEPTNRRAGAQAPPRGSGPGSVTRPAVSQAGPGSDTAGGRLGGYLAGSLVDGDHIEIRQGGRTYVDYDATADVVLALRTLGEQPEAVTRATRFLLDPASVNAYVHGVPYEKRSATYVEPLAKLSVVAAFAGRDGGRFRAELARRRTADGTFVDTGDYADIDDSVRRHAWATIATTMTDERASGPAIDRLIAGQCADGTFPKEVTTNGCETGDLAATALAVTALNSASEPSANNAVPDDWSASRVHALERAAAALNTALDPDGMVRDRREDIALSSIVAGGRYAVGLDASTTARSLGALLLADGGLPKSGGGPSDFAASVAAAPGIAGRSWLDAPESPVRPAVRLPLADPDTARSAGAAAVAADRPQWVDLGLVGLGLALAAALGFGLRHFIVRNTTSEVVSPS